MENRAKIYLLLPPDSDGPVSNGLFTRAYLRYRIGSDFRLYRASGAETPSRGLMVINVLPTASAASPVTLAGEIVRECMLKNYEGVLLDAVGDARPLMALVSALVPALRQRGMKLYLPREAATGMSVRRIITAAPDEGDLRVLLGNIRSKYARGGFAVDAAVRREDINLTKGGFVTRLTQGEMEALIKRQNPKFYYSDELMAEYAAYSDSSGDHMLLRDTARSMAQRIHAAGEFGGEAVFIVWQEVKAFWPRLEALIRS